MGDEGQGQRVQGKELRHRPRHRRPPLQRDELIAYNWGGQLFDVEPDRVMAWFVTKQVPDRNMSEDELWSWEKLGFDRFWFHAWNGLNDAAAAEATADPT